MVAALKVGILNDLSHETPGPADTQRWLRLAVDDLRGIGRIDREVEFVYGSGLGLPAGTTAAVERAFLALVEQDVLLIVGPAIGDNALAVTPLTAQYRVPTLNWAGAERARGAYMFHLQVGSHEDESILLARALASRRCQRVGVIYDRSAIGLRHLQFLQHEAEILGLRIAATGSISPLADEAAVQVAAVLDAGADAVLYLGLGVSAPAVARALTACNWHGTCAMNTAGLRGYAPEFARLIDGWLYVDMHADDNRTLAALRARLELAPSRSLAAAKGYDLGRLVAEGLARATQRTREGVREGLELVKWLPAAQGHEGTLLGFGAWDRGALHGRYLVLRQWCDGQSVEAN